VAKHVPGVSQHPRRRLQQQPVGEAAARVSRSVSARGRICETGRSRGLGSARGDVGDGRLVAVAICLGIGGGGGRGDWRESERWADWVGDGGALVGGRGAAAPWMADGG
jgi:hypothetical protein